LTIRIDSEDAEGTMVSTTNNSYSDPKRLRLARFATTAVVASVLAATGLAGSPAAFAVTGPPPGVTPMLNPPTRIATPPPPTPAYVAPLLIPAADVLADNAREHTLTVRASSKALGGLTTSTLVGRILVVTPPGHPQMVAEVTSDTKSATAWTIVTTPVSAMAALAPGDYPIAANYTGATFTTSTGTRIQPNVTRVQSAATVSYTAELGPYTEQYSCGSGTVNLSADLKLTPSIDAGADIGWFSLNSAHLIAGVDEVATLTASTSAPDTGTSCSKSVTLGKLSVPLDIGPLVATVTFSLKADLKASLQGTMSASVVQTFSGRGGVTYDGNTWSIVNDANASAPSFPTPKVTGTNNVEIGLTAEASLSFYDVISGRLDLRGYGGIKAQVPPAPTFDLYAGARLTYEIDVFGYNVADGTIWGPKAWDLFHTPVITSAVLPSGHWGPSHVAPGTPPSYSFQLSGNGGIGALSYKVIQGSLPIGLTLSSSGLLSGTPSLPVQSCGTPPCPSPDPAPQTFTFTVQVTDTTGLSGSRQLSLTVGSLFVTTTTLPNGVVGQNYAAALAAFGAAGATTWHLVIGQLPPGLTLSPAGQITGTATKTGRYAFFVEVIDSAGNTATATESITINAT
jgi:hypothetical protein